ncbi:hypothetical protein FEE96_14420 [Parasedimentitalea maritima]|nr:hypothetical protein [Zongyanglinia marina]TLP61434.1 hypothetical protein FEE96_14420 [Zongyanglinia marina]
MTIKISIVAADIEGSAEVNINGDEVYPIRDADKPAFHLDNRIKDVVKSYALSHLKNRNGASDSDSDCYPNDAYLSSNETTLYGKYKWKPVNVRLRAMKHNVRFAEPEVLAVGHAEFGFDVKGSVSNSHIAVDATFVERVTKTTNRSVTIGIGQEIKYGISVLGTGGEGTTSFNISSTVGEGFAEQKEVRASISAGQDFKLEPGQKAVGTVYAHRMKMLVDLDIEATVEGAIACNFNPRVGGSHYWGIDASQAIQANGMAPRIVYSETIEVEFYTNFKVDVKGV